MTSYAQDQFPLDQNDGIPVESIFAVLDRFHLRPALESRIAHTSVTGLNSPSAAQELLRVAMTDLRRYHDFLAAQVTTFSQFTAAEADVLLYALYDTCVAAAPFLPGTLAMQVREVVEYEGTGPLTSSEAAALLQRLDQQSATDELVLFTLCENALRMKARRETQDVVGAFLKLAAGECAHLTFAQG